VARGSVGAVRIRWLVWVGLGLAVVVLIVLTSRSSSSSKPLSAAPLETCAPNARMQMGTPHRVAWSESAYDASVKAAVAHDRNGLKRLLFSHRFVTLDATTRLLVLANDGAHVKARILHDQPNTRLAGHVVWLDCSWLT
jgi:hypothetical protein